MNMKFTKIQWTDISWNPVTGCDRISKGCDHCYALAMARRLKLMGSKRYQLDGDDVTSGPGFGVQMHEDLLGIPYRWGGNRMVFVNSMSDLFHAKVSKEFIYKVIEVIRETPQHTYQVLTKRPKRAMRLLADYRLPDNLWLGVSVERPEYEFRLRMLEQIPACVRFVSCEPLLGSLSQVDFSHMDWVIVGGETGPGARPMMEDWVFEIRDKCQGLNIPFFFKQWGGRERNALIEGREWREFPSFN